MSIGFVFWLHNAVLWIIVLGVRQLYAAGAALSGTVVAWSGGLFVLFFLLGLARCSASSSRAGVGEPAAAPGDRDRAVRARWRLLRIPGRHITARAASAALGLIVVILLLVLLFGGGGFGDERGAGGVTLWLRPSATLVDWYRSALRRPSLTRCGMCGRTCMRR